MDQLHRPDDHFFNAHAAYLDFTRELRHMRRPYYPEYDFFNSLSRADERDNMRWLASRNAAGDDEYFARQHACPPPSNLDDGFDPRWLDDRSILHQATGATSSPQAKSGNGEIGRPRAYDRKALKRKLTTA